MKRIVIAVTALLMFVPLAAAEDLDSILKRVTELVEQKNYTKALEELGWARKEIEKMNASKVEQFFPDQLAGLTGGKFSSQGALGFSTMERVYRKVDGSEQVKVGLLGGSGAPGMEGLGGLAGLGKMAAMMGAGPDTIRLDGRTASLQSDQELNSVELTIFLDSGSMLKFEMTGSSDGAILKKMAEEMKIADLDNYLRGTKQ